MRPESIKKTALIHCFVPVTLGCVRSLSPACRSAGTRAVSESPHRGVAVCTRPQNARSHTSDIGFRAILALASACWSLRSSPAPLQLREPNPSPWRRAHVGAVEHSALHRRRHSASHEAVEPVVVETIDAEFPLIDGSSAALRFHPVLAREVLGDQLVIRRCAIR